ncbi:MAG: hypothetical protein RIQ55_1083 [Pseudomonadota bacterium]|jgi:hypothetical protein
MTMMKKITSLFLGFWVALFGQAHAQTQDSFEREFAKFDKDFERLNNWKAETPASKKLKRAPAPVDGPPASDAGTTPLDAGTSAADKADHAEKADSPPDNAQPAHDKSSALPKGAKVERLARNERLGNQISDPEMRKKVQALYRRSDVVVQQYVLPTN